MILNYLVIIFLKINVKVKKKIIKSKILKKNKQGMKGNFIIKFLLILNLQIVSRRFNFKKKENLAYLKKLDKVKSDRRKQIDKKFEREHAKARETHPYFLNIKRANDSK